MGTVFLSYRSRDRERGTLIGDGLRKRGHLVLTGSDFPFGTSITKSLSEFLGKADVSVFVVSAASRNADWMANEIGAAVAISETNHGLQLIPVIFDHAELPNILAMYLGIHASDDKLEETIDKLAAAVDYSHGKRTVAALEDQKTQERIEQNAAEYISGTFEFLKRRETTNKTIAYFCYAGGLAALIAGVFVGVSYTHASPEWTLTDTRSLPIMILLSIRGLIIIGLLVGISKYVFNLGKAFMNEGLRNSDRYHAISFGSFYLKAFGDKVTWEQLKEVFQTWNIDSASAFTKLETSDYDPKFLEAVVAVAQAISPKNGKKEETKKET